MFVNIRTALVIHVTSSYALREIYSVTFAVWNFSFNDLKLVAMLLTDFTVVVVYQSVR